jgi:Clp amino terminal domain, pathogenicity island component/UvrB/uvrC motif
VFERFTERARQVVVLAQDEARSLRHNYIGTEHLLLGLIREQEGLAARVLSSFDVTVDEVRAQVTRVIGEGDEVTSGQIPFTPRAKKVLELSLREALSLGHNYIGTEHILLGLVRENEGVAARILIQYGATAEAVRNETIGMLSGAPPRIPAAVEEASVVPPAAPDSLGDELGRLRADKERAIEAQDFERAVALREEERRVARTAREQAVVSLERADEWSAPIDRAPPSGARVELLAALVLAAAAFPLGLFVGWLIWG